MECISRGYLAHSFYVSTRPYLSSHPFIHFLPDLWMRYFENKWSDYAAGWHNWSTARAWNCQLWGSGGQRSRSHDYEAEVRFGGTSTVNRSPHRHSSRCWLEAPAGSSTEKLAAASGRRRWPICWCCLDRGPGSFDVEDATTLSWSSAAVSEWVSGHLEPLGLNSFWFLKKWHLSELQVTYFTF